MVGGNIPHLLSTLLLGSLISLTGSRKMGILMAKVNKDLDYMIGLIEAGKIKPVIDKKYPLEEAAEGFRYLWEGKARGKVVITMEDSDKN
jgi:NADPH:quinone reductase-like Zn-dependent oxidoreductase